MIIEQKIIHRKQYGPVSVLLVQIGLALYVIVVFLSQAADGSIHTKVLKMQKVAEAKTAKMMLPTAYNDGARSLSSASTLPPSAESAIFALLAPAKTELQAQNPQVVFFPIQKTDQTYNSPDLNCLGSKPRAPSVIV